MANTQKISGDICLQRLIELANDLRQAVDTFSEITLDGATFSSLDFAGLQMLLAAQRRAASKGVALRVEVPQTGALREALARYGYGDAPPLPFVEAA